MELHIPQAPQQFPALVTPELKETTVTLPSGLVALTPSAGDGLEGCTDAQIALASAGLGSCPNGSQVGTIEVDDTAVDRTVERPGVPRHPALRPVLRTRMPRTGTCSGCSCRSRGPGS